MIPIECHKFLVKLGTVERSEVYPFSEDKLQRRLRVPVAK